MSEPTCHEWVPNVWLCFDREAGPRAPAGGRGGGAVSGIYWTDVLQPIYEAGPFWNNGRWA